MFYCEKCRKKNEWPEGFRQSYGPCEICGKTKECYDIPSQYLTVSKPKQKKNAETISHR